ncbi:ribbon-helix-helix domain-containing protein [Streptomyces sp. NPDC057620]|uniref:ribbon-helix-helix domain-containing protein n=1 Tax=Streptomyces sp. NPDC057620 TaxID=3346185 RepID=UPI0036826717
MARPATGQTPVVTFRPPPQLKDEFDEEAKAAGRSRSDALIEAMHDWLRKQRRARAGEDPTA